MANHLVGLNEGRLSLREELNVLFPPKAPSPTPIAHSLAAAPGEEVRQGEGKAPLLAYDGKYLETPFQIPNLSVSLNSPWNARKFHYHLTRPLFSKKMAAQYKSLTDPYAALAQSMKHIVHAVNGTHILARWTDHLARVNSALEYQLRCQKKAFSHKNTFLKGLDIERIHLTEELEALKATEAAQEDSKSCDVERVSLVSEKDASQARCKELEQAKVADRSRAAEALNQSKKERTQLWRLLLQDVPSRLQKIREFLNSSNYEAKIRSECAAYFATLALDHKDRFPDLVTLFNEEKAGKSYWYGDITVETPAPVEEGDNEEAEVKGGGEEVEDGGEDSSPPP
ncbi:hypothetical protein LIER_29675 [Lithospermum erythrorhizon]|uniref:Uncharacterized protein n=1 Tax=Lithospermum erythrorhizon TaxID=34254 RepID=A0AAV3RJY1_LITER